MSPRSIRHVCFFDETILDTKIQYIVKTTTIYGFSVSCTSASGEGEGRQQIDHHGPHRCVPASLRDVEGGVVDRDAVLAVQTPQGFPADRLRAAHASGADASDDATLVEADGGTVVVVDGDPANLKLTRPVDLALAAAALRSFDRESASDG